MQRLRGEGKEFGVASGLVSGVKCSGLGFSLNGSELPAVQNLGSGVRCGGCLRLRVGVSGFMVAIRRGFRV